MILYIEYRRYHGSHSQPSTCRKLGVFAFFEEGAGWTARNSFRIWGEWMGRGAWTWEVLAPLVRICHIQVVHVRNSFLMKACRLALEGIIDEEKKILTWFAKLTRNLRTTPQLDSAVPPVPPPSFQLRFTVRDGHGTELMLRRVGVGEVPE